MIGKRQLALVEAARTKLDLSAEDFARVLHVAGAAKPEALSRAGFDLAMDQLTALDFRDRRRPVLSANTLAAVEALFATAQLTPYEISALVRGRGGVGELRDLDGAGLVNILAYLSARGADVESFVARRRSVTRKQLALLHAAAKAADLDPKRYSWLLQSCGGVNSAGDLNQRGFDLVLAGLRFYGFDDARPVSPVGADFGDRPGFASAAQLRLIRELWAEWSGSADEADLVTWLERSYRVSALRFLTGATASAAITALKAMKRRRDERPKVTA